MYFKKRETIIREIEKDIIEQIKKDGSVSNHNCDRLIQEMKRPQWAQTVRATAGELEIDAIHTFRYLREKEQQFTVNHRNELKKFVMNKEETNAKASKEENGFRYDLSLKLVDESLLEIHKARDEMLRYEEIPNIRISYRMIDYPNPPAAQGEGGSETGSQLQEGSDSETETESETTTTTTTFPDYIPYMNGQSDKPIHIGDYVTEKEFVTSSYDHHQFNEKRNNPTVKFALIGYHGIPISTHAITSTTKAGEQKAQNRKNDRKVPEHMLNPKYKALNEEDRYDIMKKWDDLGRNPKDGEAEILYGRLTKWRVRKIEISAWVMDEEQKAHPKEVWVCLEEEKYPSRDDEKAKNVITGEEIGSTKKYVKKLHGL